MRPSSRARPIDSVRTFFAASSAFCAAVMSARALAICVSATRSAVLAAARSDSASWGSVLSSRWASSRAPVASARAFCLAVRSTWAVATSRRAPASPLRSWRLAILPRSRASAIRERAETIAARAGGSASAAAAASSRAWLTSASPVRAATRACSRLSLAVATAAAAVLSFSLWPSVSPNGALSWLRYSSATAAPVAPSYTPSSGPGGWPSRASARSSWRTSVPLSPGPRSRFIGVWPCRTKTGRPETLIATAPSRNCASGCAGRETTWVLFFSPETGSATACGSP